MELVVESAPHLVRTEYRGGRPRDVDVPALIAETVGRLLARLAGAATGDTWTVYANGLSESLSRLWPMVEALAKRPSAVRFASDPSRADVVVTADVSLDSAWVEARDANADEGIPVTRRSPQADAAGRAVPTVGGLDMPLWWEREEPDLLGLRGSRCTGCGRVEFPRSPVRCTSCHGDTVPHVLDTRGRILTWTWDRLYESGVATGMVVVDLTGGGRFYGQAADGFPVDGFAAGDTVRLVPRVLHADERRTAYFWKVMIDEGEPVG